MIENTPHLITAHGAEILFKHTEGVTDYTAHAAAPLRATLETIAEWSKAHGLPPLVITCGGRNPEENEALPDHAENSLHLYDADGLFWAVDLRVFHYTAPELQALLHHLDAMQIASGGAISYVHKLAHGTAPHIHLSVKHL